MAKYACVRARDAAVGAAYDVGDWIVEGDCGSAPVVAAISMSELREAWRARIERGGDGGFNAAWDFCARSGPEIDVGDWTKNALGAGVSVCNVVLRVIVGREMLGGGSARGRRWRIMAEVGNDGDFERSFEPERREEGRNGTTGGRAGADLLLLSVFFSGAV